MKRSKALIAGFAAATLIAISNGAPAQRTAPPGAQSFAQKGTQLRSDIESAYQQLRRSQSLSNSISVGNDASAIVERYVPVGSSFDDAVAILSAAGCNVRASKDRHLLATLVLGGIFDTKHTFAIDLAPQSLSDNPAVAAVRAKIVLTYVPNGNRR